MRTEDTVTAWLPPLQPLTLALLAAGMLGSFLHAWVTFSSKTWTRQALVETVLGGLGGLLLPGVPWFSGLGPWAQLVLAVVVPYAAGDFILNLARQFGAKIPGLFGRRPGKGTA